MVKPEHLSQQLKDARYSFFVLYGEEYLFIDESQQVLNHYAKEHGYLNKTLFTVTDHADWSWLTQRYAHHSLFREERSFIDLRFPSGKLSQESSLHLLHLIHKKQPQFLVVITLCQLSWQDKKTQWFKTLQQHAVCVHCASIAPSALPTWIMHRLHANHQSADQDAIAHLIQNYEGHLLALQQELTKLSIAFPAGHIATADILSFSTRCTQYTLREDLHQALLLQDGQRFQTILYTLRDQGISPSLILWHISEDLRKLLRLAHYVAENMSLQQACSKCHIFFTQQATYVQAFKTLDIKRVKQALRFCFWIDATIKGVQLNDARDVPTHVKDPWDAFVKMRRLLF